MFMQNPSEITQMCLGKALYLSIPQYKIVVHNADIVRFSYMVVFANLSL